MTGQPFFRIPHTKNIQEKNTGFLVTDLFLTYFVNNSK